MPVVLWIRENEHPGLACSFMAPCSSHFGARRLHASSTYPSGSTDSFDLQASPHNRGRWYSKVGLVTGTDNHWPHAWGPFPKLSWHSKGSKEPLRSQHQGANKKVRRPRGQTDVQRMAAPSTPFSTLFLTVSGSWSRLLLAPRDARSAATARHALVPR